MNTPHDDFDSKQSRRILNSFLVSDDVSPAQQLALLRLVVDAVPGAILVHDVEGQVLFFNEGACELLGYSSEEMLGLPRFGWIGPESMAGAAARLERLLREGRADFISTALRKDGRTTPTDVLTRRLDTAEGPLVVSVIRDVSERVKAQQELEFLAYHDSLTGLSNRVFFEERLRLAIADARRHKDILGLAYLDLDRFKPVNDRYGHDVGDSVLITLSSRLVAIVREQDIVARLGGDEFVILLPRMASTAEFQVLGQRLLDAIRQPIDVGTASVSITATIGFALFDHALDDARSLVVKADVAMYRAKRDPARPWLEWDAGMGLSFG
ncbi:MAG: hypothetical protein CVT67_04410 [Actinobacteria bacterium HGW-Actinobacteria-7]|nr:MAG: hypothetical protein CVT67_04410 [Actinobacteria bacterium HGW-Actinobacteria-7]